MRAPQDANRLLLPGSVTDETVAQGTLGIYSGNGSPQGRLAAPVGSLYRRLDGGANTTLYIKESGSGTSGWKAVGPPSGAAGGVLSGSYPNPSFAVDMATQAELDAAVAAARVPPGVVAWTAASSVPAGWLLCDGSAVSRTTYSDLFAAIGTTYGAGNGSSTFNVPNLKQRVPVGRDSSDSDFAALGQTGGEKRHQLTIAEMPAHTHFVSGIVSNTSLGGSANRLVPNGADQVSGSTGGNAAHNNLQPYIVLNGIIKT